MPSPIRHSFLISAAPGAARIAFVAKEHVESAAPPDKGVSSLAGIYLRQFNFREAFVR
jgi:hypothetical protein